MLSLHDTLIVSNVLQISILVACKLNLFSKEGMKCIACKGTGTKKDDEGSTALEQHLKTSVKLPDSFSGDIGDWPLWKVDARVSFGLSGLLPVIDDEFYAATHPTKNTIVCHFLCQSVVKGSTSRTFSCTKCLNNGH